MARAPSARDIWISSGLRSRAAPLRKNPAFSTVGFVWNSLDSLVRNEPFQWVTRDPRPIFNSCGPFPSSGSARPRRHSIRRSTALNPAPSRNRWARRDHGNRHRKGRTGHWDQTNAVFAFWQEIVDSAPHFTKLRRPQSPSGQPEIPSPRSVDARLWTSADPRERLAPRPLGPRKARLHGGSDAKTMISPRTRAADRMPGQPAIRRRQASEARRRRNRTASQAPATPG